MAERTTVDQYLASRRDNISDCTFYNTEVVTLGDLSGARNIYTNCGTENTALYEVVASPPDQAYILLVGLVVTAEEDIDVLETVLDSVRIIGQLP